MKNKWSNYALKDGKVQSSYIREYCNRKKIRKTGEASNCNSNVESRKEQIKEEITERSPIIEMHEEVIRQINANPDLFGLKDDAPIEEQKPKPRKKRNKDKFVDK